MKIINIVKIHSVVDVITNSSTELFVCNTKESLQIVNDILQNILDEYNMENVENNFSMDVFETPYIFDVKEYREWKSNNVHDHNNKFSSISGWFSDDKNEEDLKRLRMEIIENGTFSGMMNNKNPYEKRLCDASRTNGEWSYELRNEEVQKIYDEIKNSKIKPNWWKIPWKYDYMDKTINDLDGCVIIAGSYDNSIPYDIWQNINAQLNGENYHLG